MRTLLYPLHMTLENRHLFLHLPGKEAQSFSAVQPAATSHYTQHCRQTNDRIEYDVRASALCEPGIKCVSYCLLTRHPKCLTPQSWVVLRFRLAMRTGNVLRNPVDVTLILVSTSVKISARN